MKILTLAGILAFSACSKDKSEKSGTEAAKDEKADKKSPYDAKNQAIDESNDEIGDVLAKIDGNPIGSKDFIQRAARKIPANGEALSPEERREIIDEMISDELVFQAAFERKLYRDPKVKKVMINALMRDEIYSQVQKHSFNEDDLKNYYNSNKDENFITIPDKAQLSRILIKITRDRDESAAKAEADRIYKSLSKDKSHVNFKALAEKFSDGPYKRRGGDVGFVSRKGKPGIDLEVIDRAFNMAKDQISEPFKTKSGFNIVMLKEKRAAQERSFSQVKGTVLRKLKNEKLKELFEEYREQIKKGKEIVIDEEKLNSVPVRKKGKGVNAKKGHRN